MLGHPPGRLKIAATYRVGQPIENFVLRIRIVQQKSLLAELFESEGETRDTNYLLEEEGEIKWREKIFSPREKRFYGEEKNCSTDLEKEYHEVIKEADVNVQESRLYSYTERDPYYPDKTILTGNNTTRLSVRKERALPVPKNRKPFVERYNKKVVDSWPTKSRILDNRSLYRDPESMYVLVDLSSKDDLTPSDSRVTLPDSQVLLCTVTHDRAAETLTIDPDFSNEDSYTVEANGLFYDYWIEDGSSKGNNEDNEQRKRDLRREIQEKRGYEDAEIFREISMPPANILRSIVNLEIVSARDFDYDPLFVTYYVDLPRYWVTSDSERLTGRTQRSRVIGGKAHFGYISEIPLDFDLNSLKSSNPQPSWPYLIFTIGSIDSWTRYRIEGYASLPLPPTSGHHRFEIPTWRPIGGFVNVLRRFFTGGTSEIVDITYCGIPDGRESSKLEKNRLKVAPGGYLKINMNIVHQSKIFMKNRRFDRDAYERLSAGTIINSLDNVLEQFKAARERMVQAIAQ